MNWFGMATNSDNAVQQAIAKMLNDVKNATDRQTLEVGIRLVKALNKAKENMGMTYRNCFMRETMMVVILDIE